jgi:hypothetical protein
MDVLLRNPVTTVWLLLVAATGLSWWLGGGSREAEGYAVVSTALVVVAFVKVRFVIRYFMEVRGAGLPLRLACDSWVVGVCAAVLILYWERL